MLRPEHCLDEESGDHQILTSVIPGVWRAGECCVVSALCNTPPAVTWPLELCHKKSALTAARVTCHVIAILAHPAVHITKTLFAHVSVLQTKALIIIVCAILSNLHSKLYDVQKMESLRSDPNKIKCSVPSEKTRNLVRLHA